MYSGTGPNGITKGQSFRLQGCCGAVQTVGEGTKDGFRFFTNCLIHCVLGGAVQIITCFFLGPAAAAVTLAPLVAYDYRTKIRTKYNLKVRLRLETSIPTDSRFEGTVFHAESPR